MNLIVDHRPQLPRQPLGLVVIVIALEVEDVALQFDFRLLSLLYLWVLFCLFFVLVALVVAACRLVVLFPGAEAHPAELGTAHLTSHVVATLALLDRPPAFLARAHFRVCYYPCKVLTLARVLELPLFEHLAIGRPVLLLPALEAVAVAAHAVDDVLRVIL